MINSTLPIEEAVSYADKGRPSYSTSLQISDTAGTTLHRECGPTNTIFPGQDPEKQTHIDNNFSELTINDYAPVVGQLGAGKAKSK